MKDSAGQNGFDVCNEGETMQVAFWYLLRLVFGFSCSTLLLFRSLWNIPRTEYTIQISTCTLVYISCLCVEYNYSFNVEVLCYIYS